MAIIQLKGVELAFGPDPLLDRVDAVIEAGERVCLIGRNGSGKSSLLKLIDGEIQPDGGEIVRAPQLRIARLEQEVPAGASARVFDVVADGLGEARDLLVRYHDTAHALAHGEGDADKLLARLEQVQHELEAADGWRLHQRVEEVLSRFALDADAPFNELSGGWRRRVMLARALVLEPDLLLLDEPTNHLDIEMIEWLEQQLLAFAGTLLFITHDRRFLEALATRILELDRGQLSNWDCDYPTYLRRKEEALAAEAKQAAEFDKKLAQEEAWIRQGIKARRTRNEGRVRALQAMRRERAQRRERVGSASMQLDSGALSGKLVAEAQALTLAQGGKTIVRGLNLTLLRGDKVGIIGPNGCGKTTLIRGLLGDIEPAAGTLRRGSNIQLAYFDQQREILREDLSVLDNVAEGREQIAVAGRSLHVISYLQNFLFTPDRARAPARKLSGGERNRLMLARLFSKPFNLLVMDEPTNDLDIETLELLEEQLAEYSGTLLLVSHDRSFLNNVVTSVLAFEGNGHFAEYVGGYDDWLRQRPAPQPRPAEPKKADSPPASKPKTPPAQRKLSYREKRELEQLPQLIESLEEEQEALQQQLADPAFYQRPREEITQATSRCEALEKELADAYSRWQELESV